MTDFPQIMFAGGTEAEEFGQKTPENYNFPFSGALT
jgi:hypothetical protein